MKRIGCMPLYDTEKESVWMIPAYMDMLAAAGVMPVMLPLTDDAGMLDAALELCDGFLLTGGQDVSPELYRERVRPCCGECYGLRDTMDCYILRGAVRRYKPVLGICRGLQLMNVCFGGTLYQDLPTEYPEGVEHHMSPPYDRVVHTVEILPDTLLSPVLGHIQMGVNSYHHQAVKRLASPLKAVAIAEDGIVEAAYLQGANYVLGVQWHPELDFRSNPRSARLIRSFVAAL